MENIQEKKRKIRSDTAKILAELSEGELIEKSERIEKRLFELANLLEARVVLLYINSGSEVTTRGIVKRCFDYNKIVVFPVFDTKRYEIKLMKVDNIDTDLKPGPRGVPEPDADRCKIVHISSINIAIIPGIAFDEKGERIGSGRGRYDRFIPRLPVTTRKIALAFEDQIIQQVPVESHDSHVDIIITEKRTIYKI